MAKNTTQEIEALAAEIGENIYIDVAQWHLFLAEAHLHTIVAEKVYPLLEEDRLSEKSVSEILHGIHVKLGGGKLEVSLADLLPIPCQRNLLSILEEYQKNM